LETKRKIKMGQKFAAFDAQFNITGFYDDVDSPVPAGVNTIEITDAQWHLCLSNPGYTIQNSALVPPSAQSAAQRLAAAKTRQIAALSAACQKAIYAGFSSAALGNIYSYPFLAEDQTNMAGAVLLSTLPIAKTTGWTTDFWCADSAGVWLMHPHTAAQIQQVGIDADVAKRSQINKNISLAGQVTAATTVDAVNAIVW
jgi:hypothetical protein